MICAADVAAPNTAKSELSKPVETIADYNNEELFIAQIPTREIDLPSALQQLKSDKICFQLLQVELEGKKSNTVDIPRSYCNTFAIAYSSILHIMIN